MDNYIDLTNDNKQSDDILLMIIKRMNINSIWNWNHPQNVQHVIVILIEIIRWWWMDTKEYKTETEEEEYDVKAIHGQIEIMGRIRSFKKKIQRNSNTICKHNGYTLVPCHKCPGNKNNGLKDLSAHGIDYEIKQ